MACIRDGYREYTKIHDELGLPLEKTRAHVVAWSESEAASLETIVKRAHINGVRDVNLITAAQLKRAEPYLSHDARAAVAVPGESIIDPWSAPYAYLRQSIENGGEIFLSCEVAGGNFDGDKWRLETSCGKLNARWVINSAGLYGDLLNEQIHGSSNFHIRPRKGQFVIYDKAALGLVKSIILPVPTSRTKGVVVFPTVFGNLGVGPTAQDQESRSDASTDEAILQSLLASAVRKIPDLEGMPITATYAGIRPATEHKDYQIDNDNDRHWITVGGIRSTGLSGALGIARHLYKQYAQSETKHCPIEKPIVPRVPMLAQNGRRDWQCDGHGDIVCHCELVTIREIQNALSGSLAAGSLAGLKRQTRVTMGRCQGFYCAARLAQITDGHFEVPLSTRGAGHTAREERSARD